MAGIKSRLVTPARSAPASRVTGAARCRTEVGQGAVQKQSVHRDNGRWVPAAASPAALASRCCSAMRVNTPMRVSPRQRAWASGDTHRTRSVTTSDRSSAMRDFVLGEHVGPSSADWVCVTGRWQCRPPAGVHMVPRQLRLEDNPALTSHCVNNNGPSCRGRFS